MPRTKKSVVWDYFVKIIDEGSNQCVQCQVCNRKMKFFGNTTNLKEHLRRTHPQELAETELNNSQQSQNDGFILFVDHPKAKRPRKIKEDHADDTSEEITADSENIEVDTLMPPAASFTIKENAYIDREEAYTINMSRREYSISSVSHLGSDDFAEIVESGSFIDKSLLIEDLFNYKYILVTAPHGFGKSTNLDMVKRFLEIIVGEDGNQKDIRTTNNYKIFRDSKLQITGRLKFCKDHMGQHPVISINFEPLSVIDSFDDMMRKFKIILRRTFSQHLYLLKNTGLLMLTSQKLFQKYCDPAERLTLSEIETGFLFLSEMLFMHFKRPSVVLIDNYDAYVNSLMFKKNPDAEKIINFIQLTITQELLKSNNFVDHALLTGVFPVSSGIFTITVNLKNFYFLDNHTFCKYYGVSSDELSELLKRFIPDLHEREKTERIIAEYYGGYIVPSQNLSLFNLLSILNYLDNRRMPLNYWCQAEHYKYFKLIFSARKVGEEIQQLLLGLSRCTDISKPLSDIDFITLSSVLNGEESYSSASSLFLKLIYHLGYLTANENLTFDQSEVFLRIPNSEIRLEFARILKDTYLQRYSFEEKHIRSLHSAANAFSVQSFDNVKFEHFCKALNDLFCDSSYYMQPKDSNNFQCVLFTFMASKFCITQSEIYKSNMSSSVDILTVNDSGVGIFIETRMLIAERLETEQDVAVRAHRQIIEKKCCEYFDRNFEATMGKICIGICVNEKNNISIAYSYNFQMDDDIENVTFLESSAG